MIDKIKSKLLNLYAKIKRHWRKILIYGASGAIAMFIIVQVFYPSSHLVLFSNIDGLAFGGWSKTDAIKRLDILYKEKTIPIYFGKAEKAYKSPKPSEIGMSINNEARINKIGYPWYLRLVPTSILWVHFITEHGTEPKVTHNDIALGKYITSELGTSCKVEPINANLKAKGDRLEVIPSHNGGICDINLVKKTLLNTKPKLADTYRITIPVKEVPPDVNDSKARQLGDSLQNKAGKGVNLTVNNSIFVIPTNQLFEWLDFSVSNGQLDYSFNAGRSADYLNKTVAPKVAVAAGTTTVRTYDFVETSRVNGVSGSALDINATLNNIKAFLGGQSTSAVTATAPVPPKIVYTRSYSPTDVGLSALMQNFSTSHPGSFGVALIELSGANRRASYNGGKSFTTASTFKLFVAYSTLKRIENGSWHWTDQINGGRNLTQCFDDMIVRSDNACAEALLIKIGFANITNEAHALGCNGTSFMGKDGIKTTPNDLALFLAELQSGQMLSSQANRDILINAMKRNIYRQGIPAGLGGLTVADKVGFLDGLFHDASIVYGPTGTYVLVIMTEGSSWSTIADFARSIESLRIQ